MTAASRAFFVLQDDGYKCRAENSNDGNSITFNNAKGMYAFLDGNYDQYLKNGDSNFDQFFLDIFSLATADAPKNTLSSSIGKSMSYFFIISDVKSLADNLTYNNVLGSLNASSDLVIDVVGVYGVKGACLSIGLKYTKQGFVFGTYQMGKASVELEKYIVNKWSNDLFGIYFK